MLATIVFNVAALARRRQPRLDDVGDAWRALLLGAPPALRGSAFVSFAVA